MPVGFLLMAAGFGTVTMLLWNWLMPAIFGLGSISFWQALGLLLLCRVLWGGFGSRRYHGGRHHHHHHGGGRHGDNPVNDKWMKMTPEQRKEFIIKRKAHFGRGHFFADEDFGFTDGKSNPERP